jgi:hypothetical protein
LSQSAGAETERAQKDSAAHTRRTEADAKAEQTAGIGQTEQDQETSERDADGRRFWEGPADGIVDETEATPESQRRSRDPSGQSGNSLDLTG